MWLGRQTEGPVLLPGDDGYDLETATFNLVHSHRAALVVGAAHRRDVQAAVRFAARNGLPVAVVATGHGAVVSSDGAVLVNTRRLSGVTIDPDARTARIEAGVRWQQVIDKAAVYGLAPMAGSAPAVGAVAYLLGGGLSPVLGRSLGYAADHIRSVDVVTADGSLRHLTARHDPELFWAIRGGKGNFGVVTAVEFDLFPVKRLYGGGLFFAGARAAAVLHAYRAWVAAVPEEMSSSVVLLRLPDLPFVPEPMRGTLTVHVRIAYLGSAEDGEKLVAPLRAVAPALIDSVAEMPFAAIGTIHNDPTEPAAAIDRSMLLRELPAEAVDALVELAGPDVPSAETLMMVEVRHLGGALSRQPAVPNAVGHRSAAFNLFVASVVLPVAGDAERIRALEQRMLDRFQRWGTGGAYLNFMSTEDVTPDRVRAGYDAGSFERLLRAKQTYDPHNTFRINHNIRPVT